MNVTVTSPAKLRKMMEFVPDVTNKGNGQKVLDCYNALVSAETKEDVLVVQSNYGGTLGYKCVCYLMEFVRIGQEPPQQYFGVVGQDAPPKPDEFPQEESMAWLKEFLTV